MRRLKLIASLALDFLNNYADEAFQEHDSETHVSCHFGTTTLEFTTLPELTIGSHTILAPTDREFSAILKPGKNGDWRTKQILDFALHYLQDHLDNLDELYYYQGENEKFENTHISFGDNNIKRPTEEEIDDLLQSDQLDKIVKLFPAIAPKTGIAWDVYDIDPEYGDYLWIDTVFYDASHTRQSVYQSLVEHDGYNPSILCRSREIS